MSVVVSYKVYYTPFRRNRFTEYIDYELKEEFSKSIEDKGKI